MYFPRKLTRSGISAALLSLTVFVGPGIGQQPFKPGDQTEDVLRINTELVQTGVTVLDKQGHFVEGLKPEQFEIRVDGKPVSISFFERVTAGTTAEEKQIAAAARANNTAGAANGSVRGRTVIFYMDDLHLSAPSVEKTRKAILEFIDTQMGPDDQVAIASASGTIGFLQTFTSVKAVLRAAIARLTYQPYTLRDTEIIPMTEYQALKIAQGDKDATDYFVTELLKATRMRAGGGFGPTSGGPAASTSASASSGGISNGLSKEMAERNVRERAQFMMKQSMSVTTNTLAGLESLMRSSSHMVGRKLVFFISDGFYLNDSDTGFATKLKQITDAAIRAGVVVYAMDARGITSTTDARSNQADGMGRLARANIGEIAASQDPLASVANDTGGRALFNSEALGKAVKDALDETSNYYLLAWRPPTDEQKGGNFKRIEVSITSHPELTVRLPHGFMTDSPKNSANTADNKNTPKATAKTSEAALIAALGAPSVRKGLPTQLSLSFLDAPGSGMVLTASTQIATSGLGYGDDGKQPAAVDLVGIIFNDQGKQAGTFKTRLNVNPLAEGAKNTDNAGVIYNYKAPLKPGIYQVRVAARDDKSAEVGSAAEWIEVPDLGAKRLVLSTLLLGGQFVGSSQQQAGGGQLQFSVDRRFTHGSHLSLLTIAYNAAKGTGGNPDLVAQIRISRNGQAVVTSPSLKVAADPKDLERILYGADVALQTLPAGRYFLEVTISDRVANTTATQAISFEIV
jgi:VWFA-related protein